MRVSFHIRGALGLADLMLKIAVHVTAPVYLGFGQRELPFPGGNFKCAQS